MKSIKDFINNLADNTLDPVPVVLFGSSNTAIHYISKGRFMWGDWLHLNLRMKKGQHFKVLNSGIGGNTSGDLLNRMDRDVFFYHAKIVVLTVGGNDCIQDVGIETYKSNLRKVIKKIADAGAFLVMQTYYCFNYKEINTGDSSKDKRIAKEFPLYMEEFKKVALEFDIPVIDQYKYFEPLYLNNYEEYKKLMIDHYHLNYIGNFIMGNFISREFGLPDLTMPEDVNEELEYYLNLVDEQHLN